MLGFSVELGLAGCSSGNSTTSVADSESETVVQSESSIVSVQNTPSIENDENENLPLEITDIAYVPTDKGYIYYTLALKNPNKNAIASRIKIDFTGRAEDGSIAFNDQNVIGPVLGDSVTYWTGRIHSEHAASAQDITTKINVSDSGWVEDDVKMPLYKFENVSVLDGKRRISITGEITMLEDVEIKTRSSKSPIIVAVFKDESGKIIDGAYESYDTELVKDEKAAFEIKLRRDAPENNASVELYANPWY